MLIYRFCILILLIQDFEEFLLGRVRDLLVIERNGVFFIRNLIFFIGLKVCLFLIKKDLVLISVNYYRFIYKVKMKYWNVYLKVKLWELSYKFFIDVNVVEKNFFVMMCCLLVFGCELIILGLVFESV